MAMLEALQQFLNGNEEGLKVLNELQTKVTALDNVAKEAQEKAKNFEESANHWKGEAKSVIDQRDKLKTEKNELESRVAQFGNGDAQAVVDKLKAEYEAKIKEVSGVADQYKHKLIDTQREAEFGKLAIPFASGLSEQDRKDAMDIIRMRLSEGLTYDEAIGAHVYKDGDIIRKNGDKPYTPQEIFNNMVAQGSFSKYLDTTPSPKGADRGPVTSGGPVTQEVQVTKGNSSSFLEKGLQG